MLLWMVASSRRNPVTLGFASTSFCESPAPCEKELRAAALSPVCRSSSPLSVWLIARSFWNRVTVG